MARYEDSVLGKLSANLQQQAEILKNLSEQKGKGRLDIYARARDNRLYSYHIT